MEEINMTKISNLLEILVFAKLALTSVLDLNPPNALPFHCLPVTSWKGRVAISWPAGATPR
jgi:hypothetical protein